MDHEIKVSRRIQDIVPSSIMDTLRISVPKRPILRFAFNWLKRSRAVLRPFVPVLRVLLDLAATVCLAASKLIGFTYLKLWPILGVYWYDHQFDYLLGPAFNKWSERGTLANRYIQPDDIVLDVACGDGSYSGNYYSQNASQVDAFDYDEKAIATARRKYAKSNINFFVADATQLNLIKKYDVVLFFAAIEHFPAEDGAKLIRKFGAALKPEGILLGSTPIFAEIGGHNDEHQNEFLSVEQLREFLTPHFLSVTLWCSQWPGRVDCYFECRNSDVAPRNCAR